MVLIFSFSRQHSSRWSFLEYFYQLSLFLGLWSFCSLERVLKVQLIITSLLIMAYLFVQLCLKAFETCSSNLEEEFLHFVTICVCEFVWKVSKNKNIFQCFIDGKILAPWLFVCGFSFENVQRLQKRWPIIELRRGFSTLRLPGLRLGD